MDEPIQAVGARMRALRESAGLAAPALAAELGVPPELYAAYEAGHSDIPIGFLFKVAARFQVELASLLTGENPRLHLFSVVRRGKGPIVERRSQYRYESLAANFVHKRMQPFLVTVTPRPAGEAVPCSSHSGQEFNHVLEGTLLVTVGGHEVTLQPGDSLFFDSAVPHGMRAVGECPARFLALVV
jgi:mannose-6-phosphate isomerase-like protein (cupin superfamily)